MPRHHQYSKRNRQSRSGAMRYRGPAGRYERTDWELDPADEVAEPWPTGRHRFAAPSEYHRDEPEAS